MKPCIFELADDAVATLAAGLERKHFGEDGVAETLTRLAAQDRRQRHAPSQRATHDPACQHLPLAFAATRELDKDLGDALDALAPHLRWERIPERVPRPTGPFMDDYAYAQIIGPTGIYPGDDFMLGLFVIGPGQFYPDHLHQAPELYWLFTGPTQWRFSVLGPWVRKEAGQVQWNRSHESHAMRTEEVPLFAMWAWTRDIHGDFRIAGSDGAAPLTPS